MASNKSFELLVSNSSSRKELLSADSFITGKHLFLGDFLGLISLGILKLDILRMTPGFRVFRPISKLTRISSALKWCSQTNFFLDSS